MSTPALTEDQEALLRDTTSEVLLTTFASLTHRMHESHRTRENEHTLRGQRDMVEAEILRRMAGGA